MPAFNFLKNTKLALVYGNNIYELQPENDISFSQTFTESTESVNTVHSPQYFERSTIVKANPASFSFTVNIIKESSASQSIVFDRLIDCNAFDLFFISDESIFQLQNAVLTNGEFAISKESILKLKVEGEAEKLIRSATNNTDGTPQTNFNNFVSARSESLVSNPSSLTRIIPNISVTLDSTDITDCVFGISAELQNDIEWVGYETVQGGLAATDNSNAMYPSGFVIKGKIFSGNIRKYLKDGSESTFLNFDTNTTLRIKAGQDYSGTFAGFDFNMPSVSYTNRAASGPVYAQMFDWRLTDNTTLSSILQYNTI